MSAIATVLWPGIREIVGGDARLGGILADKPGYHNTRNRILQHGWTNDYSIQLAIDKLGPGDEGAALDVTFVSAQGGDYRNIAKYSKLLYRAGVEDDPRTYPMREFYGNTDSDTEVEGWSYYRKRAGSSDSSHLWHIHMSIHRKYINDADAMRSILSIWRGEDMPLSESDLDKIEERLMKPSNLNKIADAVAKRDGNVANNFTDNSANEYVSIATALGVLGERTQSPQV